MKTLEKTNQKPLLVKFANQLLKDQQEIDELVLQLSLGKAEAGEKFEEVKKQMRESLTEFKGSLQKGVKENKQWINAITAKLEALEIELGHSKAVTKEMLMAQKRDILRGIEEVKNEIKKNPEAVKYATYYTAAVETMKLKMDILEKKMGTKKTELTREFVEEMKNARKQIDVIIKKAALKKDEVELKLENFTTEIQSAYDHFKKAIKAL